MSMQAQVTATSHKSTVRNPFAFYLGVGPYSENRYKRERVERARKRDRDSRTPIILVWKTDWDSSFQRCGRRFAKLLALDGLAQLTGAERGGAKAARPDDELRRKISVFKRIQAGREDAFEALVHDQATSWEMDRCS